MKKFVELMNRLPYFITQTIHRYDELASDEYIFFFLVFLLEKTTFDLLLLCSLQSDSA